ncbi:hypothetical protein [Bordetella tumbae]|uniref:hypothetical protein n=1 Tax=Bordetella tumbae TaxID=1649139 RepID=UPI0039EE31D1
MKLLLLRTEQGSDNNMGQINENHEKISSDSQCRTAACGLGQARACAALSFTANTYRDTCCRIDLD